MTTTMTRQARTVGNGTDVIAFHDTGIYRLTIIRDGHSDREHRARVLAAQSFARRVPESPRHVDPHDVRAFNARAALAGRFIRAGWEPYGAMSTNLH